MLQRVGLVHGGVALQGELAVPEGAGPHPAVLVMANAHGLGEQTRRQARLLAGHGYLALATDMYGDGRYHDDPKGAGDSLGELLADAKLLRSRALAWFDALRARPEADPVRLAAIGYCFGGRCVLELARSGADLRAVVSFHGLLGTSLPAARGAVKAKVVVYTGARDPFVPRAEVEALQDEMAGAKADWQITVFGGASHSFTDPDAAAMGRAGIAYDPVADRVSWAGAMAVLSAALLNGTGT